MKYIKILSYMSVSLIAMAVYGMEEHDIGTQIQIGAFQENAKQLVITPASELHFYHGKRAPIDMPPGQAEHIKTVLLAGMESIEVYDDPVELKDGSVEMQKKIWVNVDQLIGMQQLLARLQLNNTKK